MDFDMETFFYFLIGVCITLGAVLGAGGMLLILYLAGAFR